MAAEQSGDCCDHINIQDCFDQNHSPVFGSLEENCACYEVYMVETLARLSQNSLQLICNIPLLFSFVMILIGYIYSGYIYT